MITPAHSPVEASQLLDLDPPIRFDVELSVDRSLAVGSVGS
jgi:hypothetical protein